MGACQNSRISKPQPTINLPGASWKEGSKFRKKGHGGCH